jgi:hypothetical protein
VRRQALLEVFNDADVGLLEVLDLSRDRSGYHTASKLILYLSCTENFVVLQRAGTVARGPVERIFLGALINI